MLFTSTGTSTHASCRPPKGACVTCRHTGTHRHRRSTPAEVALARLARLASVALSVALSVRGKARDAEQAQLLGNFRSSLASSRLSGSCSGQAHLMSSPWLRTQAHHLGQAHGFERSSQVDSAGLMESGATLAPLPSSSFVCRRQTPPAQRGQRQVIPTAWRWTKLLPRILRRPPLASQCSGFR